MGLFSLFLWLYWVVSILSGFTFTDPEDFTPLLTLIFGLVCVAKLSFSPQKPASPALIAATLLLSLWPLLPHCGLFFLAREFQAVGGAWPQIMVDDPKNQLGHVSPLYDALFHLTNYLQAFAGAWLVLFLTLFFALQSRFSSAWRGVFLGVCGFSMLVFLFDPGALYTWWLD